MIGANSQRWFAAETLLLQELTHRINNEFSAAICTVSLAASRCGDNKVKLALLNVSKMLHHHADVHHTLQMPERDTLVDAAKYLRKLCYAVSRSKLDHRKIALGFRGPPLQLHSSQAWLLGLIVYELITNASRHAFSGGNGKIRVELVRAGARVICTVLDNGSAPANVQPGRGLKIIRELVKVLSGSCEQHFGAKGSRTILAFPFH